MLHRRKFVRDSLGYAFSQYLARSALLLRGLAAAWKMGPSGYGGWNALNLILDYGAYSSLGVIYGLDLQLPGTVERQDRARARTLCRGAAGISLLGGAVFATLVAAYLVSGHHELEALWGWGPAALMVIAALLQLAIAYHAAVLRAHGRIHVVSAAGGTQALVGAGVGVALLPAGGVWGLIGGWILGQLLALLWLRRAGVEVPLRPALGLPSRELLAAGFPISGFFVASLVLRSADRLAFLRYLGSESLGLYSLGLMAAGLVLYPPEAAGYVLYPRVAAAHHGARDPERTRGEVMRAHRFLCVLLPLAVGIGVLWAEPAVRWLLPAYRAGVPALRVLACGALALSAATVPAYYLLASGRSRPLLACGAAAAAFTLAAVFWVAGHLRKPVLIACASATGYLVFALLLVGLAAWKLESSPNRRVGFLLASLVPALWGSALALGLSWPGLPVPDSIWLRSALFLLGYAPVLQLARGVGLSDMAREFFPAAVAAQDGPERIEGR